MICSACGTENEVGRKFCMECAARLAITCPVCGSANAPEARFCGECAAPLTGPAGDGAVTSRAAVVSPSASVAERRVVSVLFADLVGFTPFAEERDAEDVRETLSRYFELASAVIERYGGLVEKFIGDAVMAVWGTPIAHEDDAERAVRAALDLVDAVRGLGSGMAARVGVLTGEAATTIGATNQGMVAGDLVNTAARLQGVAQPGTVLVGEATMRATEQSIAFDRVDEKALKGKSASVTAYRALRVLSELGGRGRSEALEAPFVGRSTELRLLKDLLEATGREKRARLVTVSGPAGIGKSRLVWELEKYLDGVVESVYWHRGRSPSYGQGISFWALGEIVRGRAGLAEADDEATTRTKISATVAEYVADADDRRWVEPALLALLGLEPPPAGGRDVLFAAWRIFFERIAERGTAVLLFEDVQWADSGLLDFIDHLLEWSKGRPIMVVALTRPDLFERRPDWGTAHRNATAFALEPLSPAAMQEILDTLVPGLPEPAARQILARADGMPLYAVELLRSLLADGHLVRDGGAYRVVGEILSVAVPETLRSLIGARLDALAPHDRSLLQDAAVLGQSFVASSLAAVSGRDVATLDAPLRGLVRRELLTVQLDPRSPERGQYSFVQSLTREVAYATLSKRDRRARHLAAARHFEMLGDDELAGVLAAHYVAAYEASAEGAESHAVSVQARLALRSAADRAAALGSHAQAIDFLERALSLTTDPAELAALLMRAGASADLAARYDDARAYGERAIEAFLVAGDGAGAGRAAAALGTILINGGHTVTAVHVLEQALTNVDAGRDPDVQAALLAVLSRGLMRSGDVERTIEVAERALSIAEPADLEEIVAEALINKGSIFGVIGRRREAVAIHEVAIRLAHDHGWVHLELRALNNLGTIIVFDDPRRALRTTTEGMELAERLGSRTDFFWLVGTAAWYGIDLGVDWDENVGSLNRALSLRPEVNDEVRLRNILAGYQLARGQFDDDRAAKLRAMGAGIDDPSIVVAIQWTFAERMLLSGHLIDAYDEFMAAGAALPMDAYYATAGAVRSALWAHDAVRAERAIARLEADRTAGAWVTADKLGHTSSIRALQGRTSEAVRGYAEAIRRLNDLGADLGAARISLDAVIALPGVPEIQALGVAARAVFERLGTKAYLGILDAAEEIRRPAATSESAHVRTSA